MNPNKRSALYLVVAVNFRSIAPEIHIKRQNTGSNNHVVQLLESRYTNNFISGKKEKNISTRKIDGQPYNNTMQLHMILKSAVGTNNSAGPNDAQNYKR